MNEAETRAELIDPALKRCGWGEVADTKVFRKFHITDGKIQTGGKRSKPLIADYILSYKNVKLAIVEANGIYMRRKRHNTKKKDNHLHRRGCDGDGTVIRKNS